VGEVSLVGLHGGEWFGAAARRALEAATVVLGAPRHLAALPPDLVAERVALAGPLDRVLDDVVRRRDLGERVCVVVSGDPGFFGLARLARARLQPAGLTVHPAPAAVALACGRVGLPWDDAVVVSAHGRPLAPAVEAVVRAPKVAVLCSPENPPQSLGRALLAAGCGVRDVIVAARLGEPDEVVWSGDTDGLAGGLFDGLSVVICVAPGPAAGPDAGPAWAWGRPDDCYVHRDGLITKAEVRAVALGKLRLPAAGVLWDVGAGSGSVAAECARLAPGLRVFAIERRADGADQLRVNLSGTAAVVVQGEAPRALADLPDPDRAFVGGGGLEVLEAVLARLRPGGAMVATYAALDRAVAAAARLGHLVQVAVSRGVSIGETGSVRLAAENPVFVCWGPEE
jgi:precorrin-6B C5,15-methyltransferase / cobalt-precorrin-6B C5,C15-methyltransferase